MKAVVYHRYGSPDVLQIVELEKPLPKADALLIKIHATTVTAGDWRMRKADPLMARLFNGLFKPKKANITIPLHKLSMHTDMSKKDTKRAMCSSW